MFTKAQLKTAAVTLVVLAVANRVKVTKDLINPSSSWF